MSYSQNDEDIYITSYFTGLENGKFIDIGGFDPFRFSNTRLLYESGWNGVIVEPSPKCFKSFIKEYDGNPKIKLINAAISGEDGDTKFFEANGDAISTTEIPHKVKWENSGVVYNEITVPTISMSRFINENGKGTDFISIDTEATNYSLFLMLPDWFLTNLKMICIEHDNHYQEIEAIIYKYGFKKMYLNAENIILAK